jgi:hypothetical protein
MHLKNTGLSLRPNIITSFRGRVTSLYLFTRPQKFAPAIAPTVRRPAPFSYIPPTLTQRHSTTMANRFASRDENIEDVEMEGEYADDLSDYEGSDEEMEHARASSHGTYLDGINEGLEGLEEYQPGGYHPIHLGDCLGPAGRYRVIHKLGHGGFGTVWLCRDNQKASYVAVKVAIAEVSPDQLADLRIAQLDRTASGAQFIAIPLDHFAIEGPNGTHQCIVLPVLGPCVSPKLWLRIEGDAGPFLRKLAHQSAQAMSFLHKNGICHGGWSSTVHIEDLSLTISRLPTIQHPRQANQPRPSPRGADPRPAWPA